jgi:hypothetical protein
MFVCIGGERRIGSTKSKKELYKPYKRFVVALFY